MMTVAKGLTSAIVPLGAVMVNDRIAEHFEHNPLGHGITYGSHAVGCAAALATLSVYEEDNLIENAQRMGEIMQDEYARDEGPASFDRRGARGAGLFTVIELTADRATKAPLMSIDPDLTHQVDQFFRNEGMFVNVRGDFIFGNPPLTITEEELRWALSVVDRALDIHGRSRLFIARADRANEGRTAEKGRMARMTDYHDSDRYQQGVDADGEHQHGSGRQWTRSPLPMARSAKMSRGCLASSASVMSGRTGRSTCAPSESSRWQRSRAWDASGSSADTSPGRWLRGSRARKSRASSCTNSPTAASRWDSQVCRSQPRVFASLDAEDDD